MTVTAGIMTSYNSAAGWLPRDWIMAQTCNPVITGIWIKIQFSTWCVLCLDTVHLASASSLQKVLFIWHQLPAFRRSCSFGISFQPSEGLVHLASASSLQKVLFIWHQLPASRRSCSFGISFEPPEGLVHLASASSLQKVLQNVSRRVFHSQPEYRVGWRESQLVLL